jgi:hypothetical protein
MIPVMEEYIAWARRDPRVIPLRWVRRARGWRRGGENE